jgi:hypothetical protein
MFLEPINFAILNCFILDDLSNTNTFKYFTLNLSSVGNYSFVDLLWIDQNVVLLLLSK